MKSHINRKVFFSMMVGIAVAVVAALLGAAAEIIGLLGWICAGLTFLFWAWVRYWRADAHTTRAIAREEGKARRVVDALIVGATVVSLVAVVFGLLRSQQTDVVGTLSGVLALVSVVVSWALINTVYAFKLARLYYHDEKHEFTFEQRQDPTYSDFAFVSFMVGMTYTFDAKLSSTEMRRVAFGYSLLAYAFGTFVIAVALNLVTSLGQSG
ncbi:DUF1345 domain-containing protein [Kocuria rhizophila]|uniref:Hypothetical membrane protein n=1 Tax=Kocuria rhizophila (strain ATCC 9341 / DSM 348 / NBRC 103217 / DC2201) TaxID=378753 RepID=B2GLW6_KOCRD|nr:DUF1345 domain-containing protein [Kocuria rhizophila]ASE10771.1 DUF1345 domain-containing protein [Kocuria rhizophila]BAG29307.1 hypothetical membrane protein [Kocuria rhizophila DC2201]VEH75412.1 Predicted membrane protein [Kocuria rhizophila]